MAKDGLKTATAERQPWSRRLLPPFAALRAFEAVGHLGAIRRAAQDLGVDHAAVSRHLRALEEWAGVSLIDRTQGGKLTAEGAKYHARIAAALDDISKATVDLLRRDDQRLVIWCVPGLASCWLNTRLNEFAAANPEIDLEVRPTDRSPDFSWHEADADIRFFRGDTPASTEDIQTLEFIRPSVLPVASPAFAATLPDDATVASLLDTVLLHEDDDSWWRAWLASRGIEAPAKIAGPRLWHAHLTLDAARRGQGVALVNTLLVGDDLKTGGLVQLGLGSQHPDFRFGAYAFRARRDRWSNPSIVRFRRWLEQAASHDARRLNIEQA